MEEQILKLMAQLGCIAVAVWIIAGALGKRDQATVYSAPPRVQPTATGDVWQRGCVAEPFAQPTFQQELVLGAR